MGTSSGSCFKVKMQQAAAARCNVYNEDGTPDLEACKPANCTYSFEDLSSKIYSRAEAAGRVESASVSTNDSFSGVSAFFGLSLTMYILMAAVFAGVMYVRRARADRRGNDVAYGTFAPIPE